ncbi:hypothetical protein V2J09_003808 [Rumex salicifolius]
MESSSSTSGSTKRARAAAGGGNQLASCLVDGCNSDLSKCRDYHRRHKVCELHSKTARVTIGGREQRFCQQCSRFHSLAEFDEGKRSCRKRLEGHNRRRRKPQPDSAAAKPSNFMSNGSGGGGGSGSGYLAFGGGGGSHLMIPASSVVSSGWGVKPEGSNPAMYSQIGAHHRRFPFMQSAANATTTAAAAAGIELTSSSNNSSSSSQGLDRALSLLSSSPSLISSSGLHYNNGGNSQCNCSCNISGGGGGGGSGGMVGIQGSELLPNSTTIHHCQDLLFQAAAASSSSSSSSLAHHGSQQTLSFLWE